MRNNNRVKNIITVVIMLCLINFNVPYIYADPIDDVRLYLKHQYKDKLPDEILNKPTIEEIIQSIDDPYTEYMSEKELEELMGYINNSTFGIGVYINSHDEGILVTGIIENSPAEKVGIRKDDLIFSADGVKLKNMSIEESSSYIKGEKDTYVKLGIKRGGKPLFVEVMRDEIKTPTVKPVVLDENIGYILITSFGENTGKEFYNAIGKMEEKNVNSYIIDLRYNGGGYMQTALEIAGMFIGDNNVIRVSNQVLDDEPLKSVNKDILIDKPVVFLVNSSSASSSEILSAAVKDYDKAYFIGETTYGKGVAQRLVKIDDGGILKYTFQEFFSPRGSKINKVGITPHLNSSYVNPLVLAEIILETDVNGVQPFIEKTDKRSMENLLVKNDEELGDNIFSGWKLKINSVNKIENVDVNKVFNIKFSQDINIDTINNNVVLMDGITGEKEEINIEKVGKNKVRVIPTNNLKPGNSYILSVNPDVKSVHNKSLSGAAITLIKVKDVYR